MLKPFENILTWIVGLNQNGQTRVWAKAKLSLEEIASILKLKEISSDSENYWEWAIGKYQDVFINVFRTHTVPTNEESEILIGIWKSGKIEDVDEITAEKLASTLLNEQIESVYFGKVTDGRHIGFKAQIFKEWKYKLPPPRK